MSDHGMRAFVRNVDGRTAEASGIINAGLGVLYCTYVLCDNIYA